MQIDTATYNKAQRYAPGHGYGPQYPNGPARRPRDAIRSIVIHTTNGRRGTRFEHEARFLYRSSDVSAHYLVGKAGQVVEFLDPRWIAWHAGTVNDPKCDNDSSIGIENHLTTGENWTPAMHKALRELVLTLLRTYPSIETVVTHRAVAVFAQGPRVGQLGRKTDPVGWDDASFAAWRTEVFAAARSEQRGATDQVDLRGVLLGAPTVDADRAIKYISTRGSTGEYTPYDIQSIVASYWRHATAGGVDPALLVAQMIHETGNLASWWAARPRRNPAGLGVTGEWRRRRPSGDDWQEDATTGQWRRGYAFASWDLAVRAHVGHILCYALADSAMNPEQRVLSLSSPRRQAIPLKWRGSAVLVTDLNGKWAVPGPQYGQRILDIRKAMGK